MMKNTGNPNMKNLKPSKELFSYHKYFLKAFFSMDRSYKFLIASFTEKDLKMLLLGISFLVIPGYNLS